MATAASKAYDGTVTTSVAPRITVGVLGSGDTASWSETFDNKKAGSRTLTPAGTITDSAASVTYNPATSDPNYVITYVNATGASQITPKAITVTAQAATKAYDGTATASVQPTITTGSLVGGDSAVYSETFSSVNPGAGLTLTPTATITDGNSGGNYSVKLVTSTAGEIVPDTAFISGNNATFTDGTAGSFAVIASGTPTPALTCSTGSSLPAGVTFADNGNGTATISMANTAAVVAGSYTVTITAANTYSTATQSYTLTVNPAPTTTVLSTSASSGATYGQSVTFTATVTSPSFATGSVTFYDGGTGGTLLGTETLSSGTASYTTSALVAASHNITAVYSGDACDATSTSSILTQVVNPRAVTLIGSKAYDGTATAAYSAAFDHQRGQLRRGLPAVGQCHIGQQKRGRRIDHRSFRTGPDGRQRFGLHVDRHDGIGHDRHRRFQRDGDGGDDGTLRR